MTDSSGQIDHILFENRHFPPPDEFTRLVGGVSERLARAAETGVFPALVTSMRRRRFLTTLVSAKGLSAPVLSFEEIGLDARPAIVGQVPA